MVIIVVVHLSCLLQQFLLLLLLSLLLRRDVEQQATSKNHANDQESTEGDPDYLNDGNVFNYPSLLGDYENLEPI